MKVTVVCTGNVARSPVLAGLLGKLRPDLEVTSAAVGKKAVAGRRMTLKMRELVESELPELAIQHRSRVFVPGDEDLVVACAPVHVRRLGEMSYAGNIVPLSVPDPAFGGQALYQEVYIRLREEAERLAQQL